MSSLWDDACRLYAADGVSALCIDLQDRHGADVPLLLAVTWAWSRGLDGDRVRLDALREATRSWQQEVVMPLRAARRALRPASEAPAALGIEAEGQADLKAAVQALELRAERLQLEALERLIDAWPEATAFRSLDDALKPVLAVAGGVDLEPLRKAALALNC